MDQDRFKDVQLNGTRYQIGRMTARNGSWVAMQIMGKIMPSTVESELGGITLPANRREMSEEEFHSIQDHCLAVCARYERQPNGMEVAIPVFVRPDTFTCKELEFDLLSIVALTAHALLFNITPFFAEGALGKILESLQGSSPAES